MITRAQVQTALQVLFPPRCVGCGVTVESDFHLCGSCWSDTPFIGGAICDACGVPLPGEASDQAEFCDDCIVIPRPWHQGRAVMLYQDNARKMVLRLKHGDRHDIVRPASRWLAAAAKPLLRSETLICPVPLHWSRFVKRRYNQSALLAEALAEELDIECLPDLLLRTRATPAMEGMTREARFANLCGCISVNPKLRTRITSRDILLVDDVMTSGATFAAATEACFAAEAHQVNVIALARVAKLP